MNSIAQQLALRVSEQLPGILDQLIQSGFDPEQQKLQLECSLTSGNVESRTTADRVPVAAVDIGRDFTSSSSLREAPQASGFFERLSNSLPLIDNPVPSSSAWSGRAESMPSDNMLRTNRRHKEPIEDDASAIALQSGASSSIISSVGSPRRKRPPDNPDLQPSSYDKFIGGIWESLFSGIQMDPLEIIEQWQAIESSGQPRLLTNAEQQIAVCNDTGDLAA